MMRFFKRRRSTPTPNNASTQSSTQTSAQAKVLTSSGGALGQNPEKNSPEFIPPKGYPPISKTLEDNLEAMRRIFANSDDVNFREFTIGNNGQKAFLVNIEGLTDIRSVNENILRKLMVETRKVNLPPNLTMDGVKNTMVDVNHVASIHSLEHAAHNVLNGHTVLFIDGEKTALKIFTVAFEHRGVEKPETESVVRGPREGFSESLMVNTALLRRKIKSADLKVETLEIGVRTKTQVNILYLADVAEPSIVEEVKQRLRAIEIDSILESGYIEDFICDAPQSIFPTVGNTEVPDRLAGRILEGRIGILVDGTPIAMSVPYLFMEGITSQEDYYSRPFLSTFIRLIRIFALHATLFLPGLYVAVINFHPNIIPERLLNALAANRSGIPFPAVVEATFMIIIWEILREAGIRIPRPSGQAIGIVGALIIGEVAVNAGLVGPIMVVIIAATGLMGFLFNPQMDPVTLLRIPVLVIASIFGLYGIFCAYILIYVHLASLRSFGAPYMSPLMPLTLRDMKDFIVRVPWPLMKMRPRAIAWHNQWRAPKQVSDNKGMRGEGNG